MDFGFAGGRSNEYYDGLLSFGDHMFVDEDVVTKHQVDSRLPTTGTLTQLMPDVARKDFPDDSITVDPMKYDRWISDAVKVAHVGSAQRLRAASLLDPDTHGITARRILPIEVVSERGAVGLKLPASPPQLSMWLV